MLHFAWVLDEIPRNSAAQRHSKDTTTAREKGQHAIIFHQQGGIYIAVSVRLPLAAFQLPASYADACLTPRRIHGSGRLGPLLNHEEEEEKSRSPRAPLFWTRACGGSRTIQVGLLMAPFPKFEPRRVENILAFHAYLTTEMIDRTSSPKASLSLLADHLDDDGELHNKNPPTPCLWQAPASA